MKKYFVVSIIFFTITILLSFYENYQRIYLYNQDKKQTITIYRPFYDIREHFYIIPYKYTNILPPKNNYLSFFVNISDCPFCDDIETPIGVIWNKIIIITINDTKVISKLKSAFFIKKDGGNIYISHIIKPEIIPEVVMILLLLINIINISSLFVAYIVFFLLHILKKITKPLFGI